MDQSILRSSSAIFSDKDFNYIKAIFNPIE